MLAYTDSFFDNLPDNTLKCLHLVGQISQSSTRESDIHLMQKAIDNLALFTTSELLHFFSQVGAAFERRYGPVPGLDENTEGRV